MSETTIMNEEKQEMTVKPYTFRTLCAEDVFPMFNIINKIGIREFKSVFSNIDDLKKMLAYANAPQEDKANALNDIIESGLSIAFDFAGIIFGNVNKCENDVFRFLASVSNLDEKGVRGLSLSIFFEMILDLIKKEEFKDFFRVVSKLFK